MECPNCGTSNPPGSLACPKCATSFGIDPGATIAGDFPADSPSPGGQETAFSPTEWAAPEGSGAAEAAAGPTVPGAILGGRYEILQLLGEGGMGAVFRARDRELDRDVALKVIRPELANKPGVLDRFKQEIILARQVTHRNVIRIFDLGTADGVKFITMEFIEGQVLKTLLRERGKYSPEEAADLMMAVAEGLDAAHREKVIHRDLKPQNIMVDTQGRALVMDFGLADFAAGTEGAAQSGSPMGTPDYMSPEQVRCEEIDARSDVFTMGVILYELLTGKLPFDAPTPLGTMLQRVQKPARPPIEADPTVPKALSEIVAKCMAMDAAARYRSAGELLHALQVWRGVVPKGGLTRTWKWVTASLAALLIVAGGIATREILNKPPPKQNTVTLLIADFDNRTGDQVFSGTLETTLKLALEGAAFISAYDRTRMRELGLPAQTGALNESAAQGIAVSQGLNVVVSGSLERRGAAYRLSLRAIQTVTGKVLTTAEATAPNKDQVLFAVTKLGTAVRKALGDATSESAQRLSMETLTATSPEAVHEYAAGLDTLSAGKFDEAQAHLSRAVNLDPNFGMAYTIMASAARNRGRFQDAEQYIKEALKHIDRMTERERYRTRAYLFLLTGDHQKCVDEYGSLLQRYPSDTGAYTNIAVCLVHLRNAPKSLELARRAVAILPRRAIYHANLAMNLAFTSDFPAAAKEAAEALKLGYRNGYLLQAFASLGQDQPAQAAEAYHSLEKTTPSDAHTGLADLAVYEGRYSEAVAILEKGAAEDMSGGKPDPDAAATKYCMLAYVQRLRGQTAPALAAAKRALELNKAFQTRFVAAQVYAALGETAKARELAAGLAKEIQIEPQAYAKLIDGEIALRNGDGQESVKLFTDANNLLDTWIGRFDLGRAYLKIGRFIEADSEFDRCIKRRGEALALFLDLPTYGYFPPVYYYQGRAREGMKTAGFAESYKKYLSIRGKGEDPLLSEVRRRAGQ